MTTSTLAENGGWTAGTLIGLPLLAVTVIVIVGVTVWLATAEGPSVLVGGAGVLIVVLLFGAWGFYPFKKSYHYWTPVTGTVAEVDKRLVRDGEGMSEKVVIRFKDDPQQYGIEDTRAALLRPGAQASLLCKKAHQWGPSVDGFDCRWGGEA
jgi:hypothetical protein